MSISNNFYYDFTKRPYILIENKTFLLHRQGIFD